LTFTILCFLSVFHSGSGSGTSNYIASSNSHEIREHFLAERRGLLQKNHLLAMIPPRRRLSGLGVGTLPLKELAFMWLAGWLAGWLEV